MVVLSNMPIKFLFFLFCVFKLQLTVSQNISRENITIVDTKTLFSLIDKQDDTLRVFNFWATWCKPCVQELPYFEELNRDQKNKKFILYLVSLDFKTSIEKKLIPFLIKKKLSGNVLHLHAEDTEFANKADMQIPCNYNGEDINIGFSSKFLTEMLSVLGADDITLKMSQPNRPGIVEPVDGLDENEHILMLSMPVIGM